jgi:hypothetical protein
MKHIKTRINTRTRAGRAAQRVAGVSVGELQKALTGDQTVLRKLGSMYQEGKMAQTLMPAIIETVKTKINNEQEWNKFLGEFVTDGSKAELEIQKAKRQASYTNVKYWDDMNELSEQFKAQMELQNQGHKWRIDYGRAKLIADMIVQNVEGEIRVLEQRSRIELKQMQEDEAYQLKAAQHLLANGDNANLELIHKRDYAAVAKSPVGVMQRFRNVLGI